MGYWDDIKAKLGFSTAKIDGKDAAGATPGRINYGYGELNAIQQPSVFESYEPSTTSGVDTLKNVCDTTFSIDTLASPGAFKAICLRVDFLTQGNVAGSWVANVFGSGGEPQILLAVVARIPEIHSCLPEPFSHGPTGAVLNDRAVSMHPTFIANDTTLSDDPPAPGDIVNVDFGNRTNMTDPVFLGKVLSSPVMFDVNQSAAGAFASGAGSLQSGTSARAAASQAGGNSPKKSSARMTQDEKLESLDQRFAPKVKQVVAALKRRGYRPKIFFGHRTTAEQRAIYNRGHSKVLFSFHTAYKNGKPNAYAADIIDSRWAWEGGTKELRDGFWNALGEEAKRVGLFWGGDWSGFKDVAHIQFYPNDMLAQIKRESGSSVT